MDTGALGFGGMQAGLCQPRRDGKQEGWGTPKKKTLYHLFPKNEGCSSRDKGGDGREGRRGLVAWCWPCGHGKG